MRFRAARILGAIGDKRAAAPLKKLLRAETDESVKEAVKEALGKLAEA